MVVRAVESALSQTYENLDVIVVDDGSTDDTAEVMRRVRYIRRERNMGAQAARNAGVDAATGTFIAFLDSDDEWEQRKVALQVARMSKCSPEVGMVYCGIRRVDERGRRIRDHNPTHRGRLFDALLERNVIGGMSVALIRTDVLRDVGPFDENLRARQDLDMWLRIARRFEIDFVAERLVIYHEHRNRTSVNKQARLQGTTALLEKLSDDLKTRPRVRAIHHYAIARLYGQLDDVIGERESLRRSLEARVSVRALVKYGRTFLKSPRRGRQRRSKSRPSTQ